MANLLIVSNPDDFARLAGEFASQTRPALFFSLRRRERLLRTLDPEVFLHRNIEPGASVLDCWMMIVGRVEARLRSTGRSLGAILFDDLRSLGPRKNKIADLRLLAKVSAPVIVLARPHPSLTTARKSRARKALP